MIERETSLNNAHHAYLNKDYVTAYALYEELLKAFPNDPQILCEYGKAKYREYDDLEKAAQLFLQALEAYPYSVETLLWLGDLSSLGYGPGYSKAASLYQQAIQLDPRSVDAYIGLGMLRRTPSVSLTLQEAMASFRKAVQLDPQRIDAHFNLGISLLEEGDQSGAQDELQAVVDLLIVAGQKQQAKNIQNLLDQLKRKEPTKFRGYWNLSPRYQYTQ